MPPPPRPSKEVTSRAWTLEANSEDEPSVSDVVPISQNQITGLEEYGPKGLISDTNCTPKQRMATSESCRKGAIGKTFIESISPVAGSVDFTEDESLTVKEGPIAIDLTQDSTPEQGSSTITIEDLRQEHWKRRGSLKVKEGSSSQSHQKNPVANLPGELPRDMPPPPAGFQYSKGQAGKRMLGMLQSGKSRVARPTRVSTGVNAEPLANRTQAKALGSATDVDLPVVYPPEKSQPAAQAEEEMVHSGGRRGRIPWPHVRRFFEEQETEWSARAAKKGVEQQQEQ